MTITTQQIADLLAAIKTCIDTNADDVAELDKAIGDGDHVVNLQRGLAALIEQQEDLASLDWSAALMKIGMTLMSTMGGASGSLFGSLFVFMGKAHPDNSASLASITTAFAAGVESVKARGKADMGEKTMLDTLIPALQSLQQSVAAGEDTKTSLKAMQQAAEAGMLSTKAMIASKGRASFLGERAIGHIDAGARTSQLILSTIADKLLALA